MNARQFNARQFLEGLFMTARVDLYCANQRENNAEGTAVRTDAQTADEFLDAFADAVCRVFGIDASAKKNAGAGNDIPDQAKALRSWLEQAFDLTAKLKGYKAEKVYERRVLWTGDVTPYHAWTVGSGGKPSDTAGYE